MKLSDIEVMIEADSVLDTERLDFESLRIPSLHSKYYRIFMDEMGVLKEIQFQLAVKKKQLTEYYLGRGTDEDYRDRPLNVKILKTDLDLWLAADPELGRMERDSAMQRLKTEMIEKFISSLNQRSFSIKTALDFKKFKAGEY